MSEGGYPAVGTGEAASSPAAESPLPAGYGSLDAGFPDAGAEAGGLERRRSPRSNGGGPSGSEAAPPGPVRPWARRPARNPPAPPAPAPPAPPAKGAKGAKGAAAVTKAVPTSSPPPLAPPRGRETAPERRHDDPDIEEGPVRGGRRPHQKVRVVRGVRSKRLVRRVDVWTVLKVSFIFYLLVMVALIVAGVIVWNVASAFGFIHSIEKSIRTLFSLKTFTLHPGATLGYGSAIGGLLCVVGVVVNVLAAVAYNLISDLVGGIQVVVVSEPD